ncbi:undecaprenyl-diphosphate phosphatase [Marisediminicola sp. LYQ134]|uniref:undecaprenyl-diphosphate phosphatase n=1 Tax=unclassified Marisediminicola TaxID=2618316 RepID=UPI0039835BF4
MGFFEAIILGLLQGLTEFLPVSSSAHLRIAGEFLPSATDPGATFTAITQLGTEAAVLVYFWGDITRIIGKWFRHFGARRLPASDPRHIARGDSDVRMGWLIIIGTVPIVLAGFFLQETIRSSFRSLWLVAIVLIVFGIILGVADLYGRRTKNLTDLTYRDGLLYGGAQMLALIPGVSRSGATTTMGRALGYERPAAAQYAFLLAVPAVFGSGFYELYNSITEPDVGSPFGYLETGVATIVAFGVGLAVIAFLMNYIKTRSFMPFVIYRIALGGTLLVLLATGVLDPL